VVDTRHPQFIGTSGGVLKVETEVSADYQAEVTDDIITCTGDMNVNFVPIDKAIKEVTIASTDGTVTVTADVPIEEGSVMTPGTSETFYISQGEWRHK